jgi:ankyrin repeat protein
MTEELLSTDQKRAMASLLKKDAQHGVASGIAARLGKLQAGSDRKYYSADIQEAFYLSVRYDWPEIVKIFLQQEVEIEPYTLAAAVVYDSADVIESFIKRGNHASQVDLFKTIELGRLRILKFFIDDGMELLKPDDKGDMPLHRALKLRECCMRTGCSRCGRLAGNQLEITELLLANGADITVKNADGDTPLHLAAASGLDDVVELLLSKNAPIDVENNAGKRPLTLTTTRDCDKAMELLLNAGADINAQLLGVGGTALHYACRYCAPRCLQMLLDRKADTECMDTGGFPPINLAASRERWRAVETLIQSGVNINWEESDGSTLLHYAIKSDKENIVRLLLERDPNIEAQDSDGKTPLIIAATRCCVPIMELLLKANANINTQRNGIGGTALHYAVINADSKEMEAVEILIRAGADLETRASEKQTALFMAAARGKWDAVTKLAEAGADVHFRDDVYSGMTTLLLAAQDGQSAVVELLLQKGANPSDKETLNGVTALMLAYRKGDLVSARTLLQYGAEVDAKNEGGSTTALLIAARDGQKDIAELLLEHGANINTQDSETGMTALMFAAQNGDVATVESMLDHGADINAESKATSGNTALRLAVLGHHQKAVELLLKRGANLDSKDKIGRTIAHQLARDGDLKTLKPFLSQKVDWTESDGAEFIFAGVNSKGVAPLHLAARYGNKDFIATLFDRQLITDIEPRCGNDFTPLHWAAHAAKSETVQALLSRHATVDAVTSDTHKTALHYAAEVADLKTVAVLLSAGASIDIRDTDQNTAEMLVHDPLILIVLQNERLKRGKQ